MEDLIVFGIIAASVVINIVRNYKKESAKDEKRVVGKPAPSASRPVPTIIVSENKVDRPIKAAIDKPKKAVLETLDSLEQSLADVKYQRAKASTIAPTIVNVSDNVAPSIEYDYSLDEENVDWDVISDDKNRCFFETNDELKRAILHTVILEPKF